MVWSSVFTVEPAEMASGGVEDVVADVLLLSTCLLIEASGVYSKRGTKRVAV